MRHRRRGRKLGRNPKHQRALLRSLASAIFLTERDAEYDENKPKVKGRIITTLPKAKEVRPLVEKCITIARKGLVAEEAAPRFTDRPGGYTRILKLAKPRLGDAGDRAILEFVGVRDRVVQRSVKPSFEGESATQATSAREVVAA